MSLINDALKRARAAQEQCPLPVAPGPQLRPAEPVGAGQKIASLAVPVAIVLLAFFVLGLGWKVLQGRNHGNAQSALVAQAATSVPGASAANATAPAVIPDPSVAPDTATAAIDPDEPTAQPTSIDLPIDPAPAGLVTETVAEEAPGEPAAQAVPAAPPQPEPLRLQAVFSHPTRPSAVVSGRTLFVGERIRDLQLKTIKGSSVTLAGPEGTIVLTLR